jgi:hypothetical protein
MQYQVTCHARDRDNREEKQDVAKSVTLTIVHFVAHAALAYPDHGIDANSGA